MFSTHSNKERHRREHCANIKLATLTKAGVGLGHLDMSSGHVAVTTPVKKEVAEEVTSTRCCAKEELKCKVEGCGEEFVRSVHLKRHLTGVHKIQNPLLLPEALEQTGISKHENDAEKVPPLKIKLKQNENAGEEFSTEDDDEEEAVIAKEEEETFKDKIMDEEDLEDGKEGVDNIIPLGVIVNESNCSPSSHVEDQIQSQNCEIVEEYNNDDILMDNAAEMTGDEEDVREEQMVVV